MEEENNIREERMKKAGERTAGSVITKAKDYISTLRTSGVECLHDYMGVYIKMRLEKIENYVPKNSA